MSENIQDAPIVVAEKNEPPKNINVDEIIKTIPQTTGDYQSHMKLMFQAILFTNAKRVLELGTDVGDSARIFATALRETKGELISVDIKEVDHSWDKDYPNVKFARGNSFDLKISEAIDLLYIDADHHYDSVKKELDNLGKWVRKGGVILLHDTCHSEFSGDITKAIREWCRTNTMLWTEDPNQHGMGYIELTHDLPP